MARMHLTKDEHEVAEAITTFVNAQRAGTVLQPSGAGAYLDDVPNPFASDVREQSKLASYADA
jgi:hypothetical protein